jgi:hypothetical protein
MASKRKPVPVNTPEGHKAEIAKLMRGLAGRHDLWRIFSDFVEMAACSIANACDRGNPQATQREARYMEIVKAYSRDDLEAFPQMLAHLTMALECGPGDVLGELFMELELGSKWHGQFFTPYSVCQLMARLTLGDPETLRAKVERQGFVTANEPACGGGAMLIAMAEAMQEAGINYQQRLHVTAQDLDLKAVHMAYVQLSLLHVPAYVIHGNSLMVEQRSVWCTPAHVMGGWAWKLRMRSECSELPSEVEVATPPSLPAEHQAPPEPSPVVATPAPLPPPSTWQQVGLF